MSRDLPHVRPAPETPARRRTTGRTTGRTIRRGSLPLAAAALLLIGAGCSSDEGAAPTTTGDARVSSTSTSPPESVVDTVPAAGPVDATPVDVGTVTIAESGVGPILVDSRGKALYVFLEDTAGAAPTCVDPACAEKWPAALADEVSVAEGVDAAALGTVERADGTRQLTAGGMPLYTMAADLTDGEPSCQGGEDVWWAVAPDGTINRTLP